MRSLLCSNMAGAGPADMAKGKGGVDSGSPNVAAAAMPSNGNHDTTNPRQCTVFCRTGHTDAQCRERHPHLRPQVKARGAGVTPPNGTPPAPCNPPPGGRSTGIPYCLDRGRGRHPPELCWQKHPKLREAAMRAGKAGKGRGAGIGKGQ